MPIEWNAEGDFAAVVDTLEPVTLYRCQHGGAGVEMVAWRFDDATDSPEDAQGAVRRRVVVWQLPLEVDGVSPQPGDVVVDGAGGCSTIRSVSRMRGATRWSCDSLRATIAPEFAERFDLERPILEETSEGPAVVGWRTVRPGLVGYFERADGLEPQEAVNPVSVTVMMVAPIDLREGDRVRRHRGGLYAVESQTRAEGIGEPYRFVATAV